MERISGAGSPRGAAGAGTSVPRQSQCATAGCRAKSSGPPNRAGIPAKRPLRFECRAFPTQIHALRFEATHARGVPDGRWGGLSGGGWSGRAPLQAVGAVCKPISYAIQGMASTWCSPFHGHRPPQRGVWASAGTAASPPHVCTLDELGVTGSSPGAAGLPIIHRKTVWLCQLQCHVLRPRHVPAPGVRGLWW